MKSPKISLIIPCYNASGYIRETLESIKEQHYSNLELIIIDGGSNDGTIEIINEYKDLYHIFISEKDNGQSDAINKGMQYCTGDIFYWINADDYIEPAVFQLVADEYLTKDFDVLCVKNRAFENKTDVTKEIFSATFFDSIEQTIVEGGMSITLFYKLSKVKQLFPISKNLHYAMDFELYFKFILEYGISKFYYSDIPVFTHFRMHQDSKTFSQQNTSYTDLNAIHYSIVKQLDAPDFILSYYQLQNRNLKYIGDWDLRKVNKKKIFGYYAKKISLRAYSEKKYSIARKAVLYALKSDVKFGRYDWYRLVVLLFGGVLFLKYR